MGASIQLVPVPSAVTSGAPGMYTRGEELVIDWEVAATDGVLTTPSDLTFTVRSPDGVDTDYVLGTDPEVASTGTGVGTLTLVLDQSSRWIFRCVTDTPTSAAETDVEVQRSPFETAVVQVPGDPGVAFEGALARAASGIYSPYLGTEEGNGLTARASGSGFAWERYRGWIVPSVDTTGVEDATDAINAAFASRNGACVYLPDGVIRIDGEITMSRGSALVGRPNGMNFGHKQYDVATNIGTLINVYGTTDPAISPHEQCTIESLCFYYPDQQTNAAPDAYPYTIDAPYGSGVHGLCIFDVTGINPEKFIRVAVNGAFLDGIQGMPLRRGIDLGRCADVVRVQNVQFNAGGVFGSGVSGATLIAWVLANGVAIGVDGAEAFDFSGCFAGGYLIGLDFKDTDADSATSYGNWRGGGIEGCPNAIRVDAAVCLATLNISDCALVGGDAAASVIDFQDSTAPSDKPRIFAANVNFWGPIDACVKFGASSVGRYIQHGGAAFGYTGAAFRATPTTSILRLSNVGTETSSRTSGSGDIVDSGGWLT